MSLRRKKAEADQQATRPCERCGFWQEIAPDASRLRFAASCPECRGENVGSEAQAAANHLSSILGTKVEPGRAAIETMHAIEWRAKNHPSYGQRVNDPRPRDDDGHVDTSRPVFVDGEVWEPIDDPIKATSPGNKTRWQHIDRKEVAHLLEANRQAWGPRPEADGKGCGGCGRTHSTGWYKARRTNGHPLCQECYRAWDAAGGDWTQYADDRDRRFKARMFAKALDLPHGPAYPAPAEAYGFKLFHEVGTPAGGTAEPFGYIQKDDLEKVRAAVWKQYPALAPAEFRDRMNRARSARRAVALGARRTPPPPLLVPSRPAEPQTVSDSEQ